MSDERLKTCRMCGALLRAGTPCKCSARRRPKPMAAAPVQAGVRLSCRMLPADETATLAMDPSGALQVERSSEPDRMASIPIITPDGSVKRGWVFVVLSDEEPSVGLGEPTTDPES